jgi:hypothetical protein
MVLFASLSECKENGEGAEQLTKKELDTLTKFVEEAIGNTPRYLTRYNNQVSHDSWHVVAIDAHSLVSITRFGSMQSRRDMVQSSSEPTERTVLAPECLWT